jgi:hypothetical protein
MNANILILLRPSLYAWPKTQNRKRHINPSIGKGEKARVMKMPIINKMINPQWITLCAWNKEILPDINGW